MRVYTYTSAVTSRGWSTQRYRHLHAILGNNNLQNIPHPICFIAILLSWTNRRHNSMHNYTKKMLCSSANSQQSHVRNIRKEGNTLFLLLDLDNPYVGYHSDNCHPPFLFLCCSSLCVAGRGFACD